MWRKMKSSMWEWWFDPIPEGHVFRLKKAIFSMGQSKQTVDGIHVYLRGYQAVNSEKTSFMKRTGDDLIIHGLFVDDIKSVPLYRPRRYCLTTLSLSIQKSSRSPEDS
jgi:hypothetical protein